MRRQKAIVANDTPTATVKHIDTIDFLIEKVQQMEFKLHQQTVLLENMARILSKLQDKKE